MPDGGQTCKAGSNDGDFFIRTLSSEYLAMLMMLLASVPLYICATGSIPIAAVLMMKGLSPGAALVLLMAGPATNVATMAVIGNSMGRRSLWVYLVSIIGGALLFGSLVNELIPREWITGFVQDHVKHGLHEQPAGWLKWVSSGALVMLMINGYVIKFIERRKNKSAGVKESGDMNWNVHTFRVEGMSCAHWGDPVNGFSGGIEAFVIKF